MRIWTSISLGCLIATFSAQAATSIQFSKSELDAFVTLVKPEETTLRLDGRKGEFRPGPSLEFIGLEPQDFDIDLNLSADLVDLRFNELRANAPTLTFEENRIRIELSFGDQAKAIRSTLGSIGLHGVKIIAWLTVSSENGVRVSYDKDEMQGQLKGTGLLKPRWVTDAIRKIALKALKNQIERMLRRPTLQASIEKGLVTWAQFSSARQLSRVAPNTVVVTTNGIAYQAD